MNEKVVRSIIALTTDLLLAPLAAHSADYQDRPRNSILDGESARQLEDGAADC